MDDGFTQFLGRIAADETQRVLPASEGQRATGDIVGSSDPIDQIGHRHAQGGGPLSIRGKVYAKGLGVHALSKITYNLNRGYKRFLADIGIDDSAGQKGSVEFKVYADGKLVYESGVLRGTAPVKHLDIDVLNVSKLVLEVTAGGDDDQLDRANWANAKVVR